MTEVTCHRLGLRKTRKATVGFRCCSVSFNIKRAKKGQKQQHLEAKQLELLRQSRICLQIEIRGKKSLPLQSLKLGVAFL